MRICYKPDVAQSLEQEHMPSCKTVEVRQAGPVV